MKTLGFVIVVAVLVLGCASSTTRDTTASKDGAACGTTTKELAKPAAAHH